MSLRFEPLTEELVLRFYGKPQPYTMRGRALMRDAEVIGIFGIYRDQGFEIVFAQTKDGLWQEPPPPWFKRIIVAAMHTILGMANPDKPLYAYAEPTKPNSRLLLEHFGFEPLQNGAYKWLPPSLG
jgi:hypothetical protein